MKKFILTLFINLLIFQFGLTQILDRDEQSQIFSKFFVILSKNKHLEDLLKNSEIKIYSPSENSSFYHFDNLYLSWSLNFKSDYSSREIYDNEATLGYYWKVDLYYGECSIFSCIPVLIKELGTFPLNIGYSLSHRWEIPSYLSGSSKYFIKISLINSITNRTIKTANSHYFTIIAKTKPSYSASFYKGFIFKLNKDFYQISPYFLITKDEIYILNPLGKKLDNFVNKFVILKGETFYSGISGVKGLKIYEISLPYLR